MCELFSVKIPRIKQGISPRQPWAALILKQKAAYNNDAPRGETSLFSSGF
jgi:hypothetical protein